MSHQRSRCIPSRTGRQIPVQLARLGPMVDRRAAHPEAPRQLCLRNALVQVVLQQHPGLPSVHPHNLSALLDAPTERKGAPSATSQKCLILGCHECEIYACHQQRAPDHPR